MWVLEPKISGVKAGVATPKELYIRSGGETCNALRVGAAVPSDSFGLMSQSYLEQMTLFMEVSEHG